MVTVEGKPEYKDYEIVPIIQKKAKQFIYEVHRHNIPSIASIFNIGLSYKGELIRVAMVGQPKSRMLMDGRTLEITRVAVKEGNKNANSKIYGACARIAKELGYKRLITYTLPEESGSSLKACGWILDGDNFGGDWKNHKNKSGIGNYDLFGNRNRPEGKKRRWTKWLQ